VISDGAECGRCGHVVFPARLWCPRCGASDWRPREPGAGIVEEVTIVRRAPGGLAAPVRLGSVRLDAGPLVTARLDPGVGAGSRVYVALADGAPIAVCEDQRP
jgi:uncharacterized OB-fold protein